jgi:hypothetical protein
MSETILRNPNDLGLHPLLKTQPWMAPIELEALVADIREQGVLQALFITEDDEVVDGRHRWKAARIAGKQVPCIVVPKDQVAAIILATILARRHYTKSARAYLALPLLEKAVAESVAKKASNLRKGAKSPENRLNRLSEKKGSDELAEKLGISLDMLQLARNTERLFSQSDNLIEKWLFDHPAEKTRWEEWQEQHPAQALPWASWRGQRLVDMGEKPEDPKTTAIIPENFREAYEDLLFTGEMGLGQINKAVGSALATKGGNRSDVDKNNPALHITLTRKLTTFTTTMFGAWKELSADHRLQLSRDIADSAEKWPEEAQRATYLKLKALYSK